MSFINNSADNISADAQSCDGGSMCLELALEGERLCKAGDCRAGVAFFQAAIQAGTDDLRILSAIYSQLGNAFFYLSDYTQAMQYHKHDLTLARSMNDKLGEAKASGNLGNTLKVMGKFSEAIQFCKRHLDISRELGDRLSEGRALYNLGNVYHAQGKQLGRVTQNDPGQFPQEVRECLLQAIVYYEENLELMRSLGDIQAMGRACGNLGNTCYLLGDFGRSITYHTERLRIANEFGDKPAERRANSNLGNSHIFLGQFENAAEHYNITTEQFKILVDLTTRHRSIAFGVVECRPEDDLCRMLWEYVALVLNAVVGGRVMDVIQWKQWYTDYDDYKSEVIAQYRMLIWHPMESRDDTPTLSDLEMTICARLDTHERVAVGSYPIQYYPVPYIPQANAGPLYWNAAVNYDVDNNAFQSPPIYFAEPGTSYTNNTPREEEMMIPADHQADYLNIRLLQLLTLNENTATAISEMAQAQNRTAQAFETLCDTMRAQDNRVVLNLAVPDDVTFALPLDCVDVVNVNLNFDDNVDVNLNFDYDVSRYNAY